MVWKMPWSLHRTCLHPDTTFCDAETLGSEGVLQQQPNDCPAPIDAMINTTVHVRLPVVGMGTALCICMCDPLPDFLLRPPTQTDQQ